MVRLLLRFLDWQGNLIRRVFDQGHNQLRLGVVCLDLGIALLFPIFTSEEPYIYFMSAAALVLAGITLVLQAVLNIQATEET